MIQAYRDSQINLQHWFYIKVLNTNYRVQKQRKLKQSSKYNTVATNDDTRWAPHPAHRCDANLPELHGEDGTHSTVHPGGSGCPIQDAQISSKSAGTQPAQMGYNNNPESTNTQQDLPDYGIYLADS